MRNYVQGVPLFDVDNVRHEHPVYFIITDIYTKINTNIRLCTKYNIETKFFRLDKCIVLYFHF